MPVKESTIRLKLVGSTDVTSGIQALTKGVRAEMEGLRRAMKVEREAKAADPNGPEYQANLDKAFQKRISAEKQVDEILQASQDARTKSKFENQRIAIQKETAQKLASLDMLAQKEPELYKKVAQAKVEIEKTKLHQLKNIDEEEARKINRQMDLDSKRAGKAVGKPKEDLSGFGGKMILGGAVGQFAAKATGSGDLGSLAGTTTAAFLFGSPGIAAAVAGLQVAGMAIEHWKESIRATAKTNIDFTNTLIEMGAAWNNLSVGIIRQNPFGSAMRQGIESLKNQLNKESDKLTSMVMEGPGLIDKLTGWNIYDAKEKSILNAMDQNIGQQVRLREYEKEEYAIYLEQQKKQQKEKEALTNLEQLPAGMFKERQQMLQQQNIARQELSNRQDTETRQATTATTETKQLMEEAEAAYKEATLAVDNADKVYTSQVKMDALRAVSEKTRAAFELAEQNYKDAQQRKQQLPGQQAMEANEFENKARAEQLKQDEKDRVLRRDLDRKTEDTKIQIKKTGYARELALQKEHLERMRNDAIRSGSLLPETKAYVEQQNQLLQAEAQRMKEAALATLEAADAQAVLNRKKADWIAMLKEANPNASVADIHRMVDQLTVAQYTIQTRQAQVEALYAQRKITTKDTLVSQMQISDPTIGSDPVKKEAAGKTADAIITARVENLKLELKIEREKIALQDQYLRGQMTRLEMEQKIALLGVPQSERARMKQDIDDTETARRKLSLQEKFMSPVDQWRKEKDAILENQKFQLEDIAAREQIGQITKAQAEEERKLLNDRTRHNIQVGVNSLINQPTGTFSTMSSRWQDLQSAALAPEDDSQRLLLSEFKGLREEITLLRRNGLPIKG